MSYYRRLTLNFERIIIKKENRQLIENMRRDLCIETKKWTPMTGQVLKNFSEFVRKPEFKDVFDPKVFYLLKEMKLELYYYRPMLLHLFSNEKPARIWFADTAVGYIVKPSTNEETSNNEMINLSNCDIDGFDYYPVIVKIAAHTSQDEFCNFIRENWKKVKEAQKEHGKRYLREIKDLDLYSKGDKLKAEGHSFKDIMTLMQDDVRIKKMVTNDDLAKKIAKGRKYLK